MQSKESNNGSTMNSIYRTVANQSVYVLFFWFFVVAVLYNWGTSELMAVLTPGSLKAKAMDEFSLPVVFITLVLAAPLLETLFGQFIPIELLLRFEATLNPVVYLLTSTIVFAVAHSYNWVYILVMLFPGFLLAAYYGLLRHRWGTRTAFWWVAALHASINLISFFVNYILKE